jgi:hypothetical protein
MVCAQNRNRRCASRERLISLSGKKRRRGEAAKVNVESCGLKTGRTVKREGHKQFAKWNETVRGGRKLRLKQAKERGIVLESGGGSLANGVLEVSGSHKVQGRLQEKNFKVRWDQLSRIFWIEKVRARKRHSCAKGRNKMVPKDTKVDEGAFGERVVRSDGGGRGGHGQRAM